MQNIVTDAIHPSKLNGTMRTLSGRILDIMNPKPDMIWYDDIAIGLANSSHFNGQSPYYFSIAQHCCMVADEFEAQNPDSHSSIKLLALMHDASEAYIGDVIKPIKIFLPFYIDLERRLMETISLRYGLPLNELARIKPFDLYIQNIEYNGFYHGGSLTYWDPERSYREFINRFNKYYNEKATF